MYVVIETCWSCLVRDGLGPVLKKKNETPGPGASLAPSPAVFPVRDIRATAVLSTVQTSTLRTLERDMKLVCRN
jgi:hypothetical protein